MYRHLSRTAGWTVGCVLASGTEQPLSLHGQPQIPWLTVRKLVNAAQVYNTNSLPPLLSLICSPSWPLKWREHSSAHISDNLKRHSSPFNFEHNLTLSFLRARPEHCNNAVLVEWFVESGEAQWEAVVADLTQRLVFHEKNSNCSIAHLPLK